jgi:flagellar basal body rod protein FlgC
MVAVLDAQRAYEANASVFDLGKRLAERTIDMGRLS